MPVLCTVWWTWDVLGSQWWSLYSFALLVAALLCASSRKGKARIGVDSGN